MEVEVEVGVEVRVEVEVEVQVGMGAEVEVGNRWNNQWEGGVSKLDKKPTAGP